MRLNNTRIKQPHRKQEDSMKTSLIALVMALGLATGALARASDLPWLPVASGSSLPISTPDLTLPSPCNSGAVVVLAARPDEESSPDATTSDESGVSNLADYKCADNPAPGKPSDNRH
jgi:hypothetical protein